jgi:hypothetical protein
VVQVMQHVRAAVTMTVEETMDEARVREGDNGVIERGEKVTDDGVKGGKVQQQRGDACEMG